MYPMETRRSGDIESIASARAALENLPFVTCSLLLS